MNKESLCVCNRYFAAPLTDGHALFGNHWTGCAFPVFRFDQQSERIGRQNLLPLFAKGWITNQSNSSDLWRIPKPLVRALYIESGCFERKLWTPVDFELRNGRIGAFFWGTCLLEFEVRDLDLIQILPFFCDLDTSVVTE